jgi:shikimate kinase / 3-dehydroquinate synthase
MKTRYFGLKIQMDKHIFIYGPPGSGKSTVSKHLADNLSLPLIDLDDLIQRETGLEISEIFEMKGEIEFRSIESQVLGEIIRKEKSVIALGGGALISPDNRQMAEASGQIICLNASNEILLNRLEQEKSNRPLLASNLKTNLNTLIQHRAAHYNSFRNQINTDQHPPQIIAWQIQILIGRFLINSMHSPTFVYVQDHALKSLPDFVDNLGDTTLFPLITDNYIKTIFATNVVQSITSFYEIGCPIIEIPAGESSKSLDVLTHLWEQLLVHGVDRKSTLISLGGGVVGDLAGFAAGTFMRGIRWINLPTTLLAQVDASLGGKTGINLSKGKNLIGAFHPPAAVIIDPTTLNSLSRREFNQGIAESIKHAIIGDKDLFELCQNGRVNVQNNLGKFVSQSAAVKIRIVNEDPYETGLRQSLNFGHTIGHAIEKVSQYKLRHGEAVSIGMVAEAYIAGKMGIAQPDLFGDIKNLLQQYDLPVSLPGSISVENISEMSGYDKKRSGDKVLFALPVKIGQVITGVHVEQLTQLLSDWSKLQ